VQTKGLEQSHVPDDAGAVTHEFLFDDRVLERRFGPAWRLLLVGANDLARHLVHCAAHLDYEIIVCDPRAEAREAWSGRDVIMDGRMPDDAAVAWDDARTAVITLTHDPRIDDLALMEALVGRSFYVGALGSARTSERRRERLLSLGLAPAAVARLHAPVGLPIGSRTPAEIALAILAHVTAERRRVEPRVVAASECAA
jgi:xanthine dehydrogenase accessory factor